MPANLIVLARIVSELKLFIRTEIQTEVATSNRILELIMNISFVGSKKSSAVYHIHFGADSRLLYPSNFYV